MSDEGATRTDVGEGGSLPHRVGPCRILRHLGTGGMGTVFLAELAEDRPFGAAGTQVALKVLHPELVHSRAFERFRREAMLGASVSHECLVRVHGIESAEVEGVVSHFLMAEYVEGRTLRDLMSELGTLPEALARHVAEQVVSALDAIHAAGALHRDLKPDNVLITPDHLVKLMDLGVAHVMDGERRLTETGMFVGTLHYAAPEQLRGEALGPAADLYALGVLLYEATTGRQPFRADDFATVLRRHLDLVPARAGQVNPQVSPFFEELLATLLEKQPENRFFSAGELLLALNRGEDSSWWRQREVKVRAAHPTGGLRRMRVPRETRLVGRTGELAKLLSFHAEAASGRGRLVLLEGEAGVGKTRLLDEFVNSVEATTGGATVLHGSYPPGSGVGTSGALTGAVVDHFGEAGLAAALGRHLASAPGLVAGLHAALTGTPPAPGSEALSAESLQVAFCHLVRSLASERPVVWIVEDVHFGTAAGRAILSAIARVIHDQRVLLIATTRGDLPAEELAHLERLEVTRRLAIGRLSAREVISLLAEALRSQDLAEELGGKVAAKTDGNPFFVFELLRELRESGALVLGADGVFGATRGLAGIDVPSSVRDLLLARLADVGQEERAMLDVAAVQGFAFDPDLIARVRGRRRLHVLEALADLERRTGVVRATGAGFQFDHHQLQQVLHDTLPPLLRAEYHSLLAEARLEQGGFAAVAPAEVPGDTAVFLADNFLRGGEARRAAPLVTRALDFLAARGHTDDVLGLASLALTAREVLEPAVRCDVRLREAACLDLLGRRDAQRVAVMGALEAAEACGDDDRRRAMASLALGQLHLSTSDYPGARAALQRAVELATKAGDPTTAAHAAGGLGLVALHRGSYDEALSWHERQIALLREAGDRDGEALATGMLGAVHRDRGDYEQARALYERHLELCEAQGLRRGIVVATANLGLLHLHLGEPEKARACFERQLASAREIGFRRGEVIAIGNLGTVARHAGDLGGARDNLERTLTLFREIGDRRGEAAALLNLGSLARDEGRLEEAGARLGAALELNRALGLRDGEAATLVQAGDVARAKDDAGTARSRFEEALAIFRSLGTTEGLATALLSLGRHLARPQSREAAIAALREAEELTRAQALSDPGPLPAAYLALLGEVDPDAVSVPPLAPVAVRAEAHLVLHLAGAAGADQHLATARQLLDVLSKHLPPAERAAFRELNPTARRAAERSPGGGG